MPSPLSKLKTLLGRALPAAEGAAARELPVPAQPVSNNVFLMVRFRSTEQHEAISKALATTLSEYGLNLIRADWRQYHDELWANVCHYMDTSEYGIAVFEQINEQATSPNVSLELGYMLAKGKRCLLLKEKRVQMLQADLAGHLCREFDADRISETIPAELRAWLKDLGIAKRTDERLLVFISQGGTCRDPMAKAILQQLLTQKPPGYSLRVEAAALGPPSKAEASAAARQAIRELYGADLLADHRPRMLTRQMMEEADLILVMDQALLTKALPAGKTFVLKPFFGLSGDIIDPWPDGANTAARRRYAQCCAELKRILETNFEQLVEYMRPR